MTEELLHPTHGRTATEAETQISNARVMAAHLIENHDSYLGLNAGKLRKRESLDLIFVLSDPMHQLAHNLVFEELGIVAVEDGDYLLTGADTKLFFDVMSWVDTPEHPQTVPDVIRYTTEPLLPSQPVAAI